MADEQNDAREKSRSEADRKSGYWNSASTSWGDESFMKELGKEGLKRQQERMKDTADYESQKYAAKKPVRKKMPRKR